MENLKLEITIFSIHVSILAFVPVVRFGVDIIPLEAITYSYRPASPRSYRVQAHKQTWVCPHGEEVHARKWKLYAATQDTA
jgi:hypothetical protein